MPRASCLKRASAAEENKRRRHDIEIDIDIDIKNSSRSVVAGRLVYSAAADKTTQTTEQAGYGATAPLLTCTKSTTTAHEHHGH